MLPPCSRDGDRTLLGIVEVPESLPPIILLPGENAQYVRTEEVILASSCGRSSRPITSTEQCVVVGDPERRHQLC